MQLCNCNVNAVHLCAGQPAGPPDSTQLGGAGGSGDISGESGEGCGGGLTGAELRERGSEQ